MILELAILDIGKGTCEDFEAAFRQASPIIASIPGYISHELRRCLEKPNRYILLVKWQTLEAHTVGFRAFPEILWPCGARIFGFWQGLSEGAWPQRPVTERKRSQKPKRPLPEGQTVRLQNFFNRSNPSVFFFRISATSRLSCASARNFGPFRKSARPK
jgi:hypothetical protein